MTNHPSVGIEGSNVSGEALRKRQGCNFMPEEVLDSINAFLLTARVIYCDSYQDQNG